VLGGPAANEFVGFTRRFVFALLSELPLEPGSDAEPAEGVELIDGLVGPTQTEKTVNFNFRNAN
jgi:hypothetical protein